MLKGCYLLDQTDVSLHVHHVSILPVVLEAQHQGVRLEATQTRGLDTSVDIIAMRGETVPPCGRQKPRGRASGFWAQGRPYLQEVLGALLQVLSEHWRVEGLALVLQQPALVAGLVCGQLFVVWPPVTL